MILSNKKMIFLIKIKFLTTKQRFLLFLMNSKGGVFETRMVTRCAKSSQAKWAQLNSFQLKQIQLHSTERNWSELRSTQLIATQQNPSEASWAALNSTEQFNRIQSNWAQMKST